MNETTKINPLAKKKPMDWTKKPVTPVKKAEPIINAVKKTVPKKKVNSDRIPFSNRIYTGAIRDNFKKNYVSAKKAAYAIDFDLGEKVKDGDLLMFYMSLGNQFDLHKLFKMVDVEKGSVPITTEDLIKHLKSKK